MMRSRNQFWLLFILLLVLIPCSVYAQDHEAKKLNLPGGADVKASLDNALARSKTENKDQKYTITEVSLEYEGYKKRLKDYLEPIAEHKKKLGIEADRWESKAKDTQKEMNNILDGIKSRKRSLRLIEMGKEDVDEEKEGTLRAGIRRLEEEKKELQPYVNFNDEMAEESLDNWVLADDLEAAIKEKIKKGEDGKLPRRPVLDKIIMNRNSIKAFEAHLEIDQEIYKTLEEVIYDQEEKVRKFSKEFSESNGRLESMSKTRQNLIDIASADNYKLQRLQKELDFAIDVEVYGRNAFQLVTDVAEIAVEGKTLPGALAESLAKLAETAFVSGFGSSFKMYNPERLMRDFATTGEGKSHWADVYKENKWDMFLVELQRAGINGTEEIGMRLHERSAARKAIRARMGRSIQKMTTQAASQKMSAEVARGGLKALIAQDYEISRQITRKALAGEAVGDALRLSRTKVNVEITNVLFRMKDHRKAAKALEKQIGALQKRMQKLTVKDLLQNPSKLFTRKSAGKAMANVGRGVAWDALRGAGHSGFDKLSENAWYKYLDHWYKARTNTDQLKYFNLVWADFKKRVDDLDQHLMAHEIFRDEGKAILDNYLNKKLSGEGMHVFIAEPLEEEGSLLLELNTAGSLFSEKVKLVGDLRSVTLKPKQETPEYQMKEIDIIKMELVSVSLKKRKRLYELPRNTKLSHISSDGNLKVVIDVQ